MIYEAIRDEIRAESDLQIDEPRFTTNPPEMGTALRAVCGRIMRPEKP